MQALLATNHNLHISFILIPFSMATKHILENFHIKFLVAPKPADFSVC
jgi:hypothetical protein